MHQKLTANHDYAKRITKIRSKTVEPVLGTLINFMSMRRVNTRGIKQANKHILMAALTYNLKKYLKFIRKNPKSIALSQSQIIGTTFSFFKTALQNLFKANLREVNYLVN
jgi:hypothetical protein